MLIAQMIARNEADRYLKDVLDRLSEQVDVISFTDDCSDDNTLELAESYDKVVATRTDEPTFSVHEGRLRSFAWRHLETIANPGDWILAIDADEMFYPGDSLDLMLGQDRYDVLSVRFYHMWDEKHYRFDKAWKPTRSSRLFRFQEGGRFRDRALACGSEPTYVMNLIQKRRFFTHTGFRMKHLGYVKDIDKISKYDRYMTLDGGDYHSLNHIKSIVDLSPKLKEWRDEE
jgi:glycosyltransferase involved in cell wall biosynthesis